MYLTCLCHLNLINLRDNHTGIVEDREFGNFNMGCWKVHENSQSTVYNMILLPILFESGNAWSRAAI
jgi:hypothetical protein